MMPVESLHTSRPTWAEVDLNALEHNICRVKECVNDDTAILAVVKMDAYGHGLCEVAQVLDECGVDYFGVASVDEGKKLRNAGIQTSILVLEAFLLDESVLADAAEYDLTITVTSYEAADSINRYAMGAGIRQKVHIKIDTGMGRIGIWHTEACEVIGKIAQLPALDCEGIFTHFPCCDSEDKIFCDEQVELFSQIITALAGQGIAFRFRHGAASSLFYRLYSGPFTMIRPGLVLYGLYSCPELREQKTMQPLLSLKSKIVFLKKVSPGRSISYGRVFTAPRDMVIATIPVGYADGYPRVLSHQAQVLVHGQRVPVVGVICMDQMMVDVSSITDVTLGDEVVLVGRQQDEEIRAEDLAVAARTIPYEIVLAIGRQAQRRHAVQYKLELT